MNNSQQSNPPSISPQSQSRSYKKLWIILGIVINVLVLLTVGYAAWAKVADAQKQEKEAIAAKEKAEQEKSELQKRIEDAEKKLAEKEQLIKDIETKGAEAAYLLQVAYQLDMKSAALLASGFTKSHEYEIGKLPDKGTDSFSIRLQSGAQYQLVSYCDENCSDIDIAIYNENGDQIATDNDTDDRPIVGVRPRWSGEFTVKIVMYKCTQSPCTYGIGVFGKG